MKRNTACLFLFGSLLSISGMAQTKKDSIQAGRNYMIDEVVVTGTRNETDVRHLPMTISVVGSPSVGLFLSLLVSNLLSPFLMA